MNAAKQGMITSEMKIVAAKEQMDIETLRELVVVGKVVIPANTRHTCIDVNGIGSMLKTKINVNLGTSRDWKDLDMELKKAKDALLYSYDTTSQIAESFGFQSSSYFCKVFHRETGFTPSQYKQMMRQRNCTH